MKRKWVSVIALTLVAGALQSSVAYSEEVAPTPTPRIIGGTISSIGQVPWQVALIYRPAGSDFQGQFCGGTILSSKWILTAAHCLEDGIAVRDLMVLAGTNELSTRRLNGLQAKRYILHPNWNTFTNENDVALIELQQAISIRPGRSEAIALPATRPETGAAAVISGWGNTLYPGPVWTTVLRRADVEIYSDAYCQEEYGDYRANLMLCATGGDFEIDTCQGDSGGPLAINISGRWEIHGITSFGVGCAVAPYPGVYAEVFHYVNWISPYLAAPPRIQSISPTSVQVGASVTVTGKDFTGVNSVRLGFIETDFEIVSDTRIIFVVPVGAISSRVRVENFAGFSESSRSLSVLPPPGSPVINGVSRSARVGEIVLLSGENFGTTESVTINGLEQAFTVRNNRQLRFTVSVGTTTGRVVVRNGVGSSESQEQIRIR